ncbi:MAG: hypothetical protein ACOCZ7_02215, partial [Armatimonadota bacterium]
DSILPQVLDVALPMLAGVAVVLWVMGRASLRMLRESHEEIPHREEMEWGARWYWALMVAGLLVPIAGMLAALTWTTYPVTIAVLSALSIGPIGSVLHHLTPWQLDGQFLWLSARSREEGETPGEFLERQRTRQCSPCARWLRGGVAAVYVGLMIWAGATTVPLDQRLMQFDRADRLAAQIVEGIGGPEVVNAHVIFEGMLPRADGNHVLIEVAEGSSQDVTESIADAAEPQVRELLPAGEWTIRVRAEGGGRVERSIFSSGQGAGDI